MASTLIHFLSQPNSTFLKHLSSIPNQTSNNPSKLFLHSFNKTHFTIKCTNSSSNNTSPEPEKEPEFEDFPSPPPSSIATIKPESFPIERRRKSEILRERRSGTGLVKPEPPNFEVGVDGQTVRVYRASSKNRGDCGSESDRRGGGVER
ncbi:hypothetical protein QYF36_017992 [Acer negundo]|nr:hypothetical protein QYF36_017992 [Acer negundo]